MKKIHWILSFAFIALSIGSGSAAYQSSTAQSITSDTEISKKIQEALGPGWFTRGYNVNGQVRQGNVTLIGNVDTPEEKRKVEDLVRDIPGVLSINNQVLVSGKNTKSTAMAYDKSSPKDFAATDTDRLINSKIREQLVDGWFSRGYTDLVIRTNNGVVTVLGRVDKPSDVQNIVDKIQKIDNVKAVYANLEIQNP